ncbi:PIG-L deacetylase family protein [Actinokineospora guangxiensis]|uniref:PIG-L deacetylase family protein n=1 Tax=Actinokineospora guangxiensis TaxID=1490288 RepID=A0ABW0ESI2_9PSEU
MSLCVVAHPDAMEYGTSAAVARWTDRGIEVGYLLLTRGEAGMPNPPEETAHLCVAEQRAACAVVGVGHLTVQEHPDGVLVYGLNLRRDICRRSAASSPTSYSAPNSRSGRPTASTRPTTGRLGSRRSTRSGTRAIGKFPEPIDDEDLEPHSACWYIVPALDHAATHGVDVTGEPLRRGVAPLEAHAA